LMFTVFEFGDTTKSFRAIIKSKHPNSSYFKLTIMQELIDKLKAAAGITEEQALKAVDTVKDFVKEKFPMMAGAVDNLLGSTAAAITTAGDAATEAGTSILDKISDVIPGDTGEKVEAFAKTAADKAEDVFDAAKEKLSGLFGGDKK